MHDCTQLHIAIANNFCHETDHDVLHKRPTHVAQKMSLFTFRDAMVKL